MEQNITSKDAFAKLLGIQVFSLDADKCICKLKLEPQHMNGLNIVQGGVLFTIADFAMAVYANSIGQWVTLNSEIKFIRPVGVGGCIVAEAVPKRVGGKISIYEVSVYEDGTNKLVALFSATAFSNK